MIFGKNWFQSSPRLKKKFSHPPLNKIRSALTENYFHKLYSAEVNHETVYFLPSKMTVDTHDPAQ